jgi:cell wall-associated NlpC family hydrolase
MKKHFLRITLTNIFCFCFLLSSLCVNNTAAAYTRYVTASSLNIRAKASLSGTIVGAYKKGTKVTCYGTSGDWTQVKYDGVSCYVSTSYLSSSEPVSTSTYTRYVTASSLNIRAQASSSGSVVGTYKKGAEVTCYGTSGDWTKVQYNGAYCYVATSYLSASAVSSTSSSTVSSTSSTAKVTGTDVVNYALQFVGNPYKYGGTSLTNGVDCSGFTMAVYARFGYSLPHYSVSQRLCGTAVSTANRKPGDLICYNESGGSSHVGIYIGNDKVVHAGSASTGIHVSTWNYRSVNCIRRIIQ